MTDFSDLGLRVEHGKALSLYERALFYSLSPDSGNSHSLGKKNQKPRKSNEPPSAYDIITNIYVSSGEIVIRRLEKVTDNYLMVYGQADKLKLIIPDRDEDAVEKSRETVFTKFSELVTFTETAAESYKNSLPRKVIPILRNNWLGLNNMCRLFMDEISFLSRRTDEINGLLHSHDSLEKAKETLAKTDESLRKADETIKLGNDNILLANETLKSSKENIRWAIRATILATALAVASLFFSVYNFVTRNSNPPGSEKTLNKILQKISEDGQIKKQTSEIDGEGKLNSSLISLKAELARIAGAIENLPKDEKFDPTALNGKISDIENRISKLEDRPSPPIPNAPDLSSLNKNTSEIKDAILELRNSINNKRIEIPKQDAPAPVQKRSIGLLNIDASKNEKK